MAEPDSPDSLPTQPWSGPADPAPDAVNFGVPPPHSPSPRRRGWQPPEPEALQASFPQYEIRGILGRGGMGAVYQGWQKSLRRLVAIKILPPGLEDNGANFAERFQREAQAMARFSHPGIVSVFDAGETPEGLLYFVMEYIEGTDVQKMVKTQGPLSPEHAVSITAHVCDALAYAHKRGVIHRDIKPSNIMVEREGQVKVADFGLAKVETDDSGAMVTGTNVSMGTPDFMAPEALHGMGHVDHRADLYAVGVMLYQMLTGELPRGRFEMPSVARPGLDARFDAIVDRAMQKNPEKRYASATDIRTELDAILTTPIPHRSAVQEPPPPSAPPQATLLAEAPAPSTRKTTTSPGSRGRGSSRRLWLSSAIAATVLLSAGGAIFFQNGPARRKEQGSAQVPYPAAVHPNPDDTKRIDPVITSSTATQTENWIPTWDKPEDNGPTTPSVLQEGWLVKRSDAKASTRLLREQWHDGAIRAEFRWGPAGRSGEISLRMSGSGRYSLARENTSVRLNYFGGSAAVVLLKQVRVPELKDGDVFRMELRALGQTLIAKLDEEELFRVVDDKLTIGSPAVILTETGGLRKIEVLGLDGAGEADTTSEASTARASSGWQPLFSKNQWQTNQFGREFKDGLVHLQGGKAYKARPSADGAIRTKVILREGSKDAVLKIRKEESGRSYQLYLYSEWDRVRLQKGPDETNKLGVHVFGKPLKTGDTIILELRAHGTHLTALVNGTVVLEADDDTLKEAGEWGVTSQDGWFESLEVQTLTASVEETPSKRTGEKWVRVLDRPEDHGPGSQTMLADGWILPKADATTVVTRQVAKAIRDAAIRAECRWNGGGTVDLYLRGDGTRRYMLQRNKILLRISLGIGNSPPVILKEYRVPPANDGDIFQMELRAVGQTLTAKLDGNEIIRVDDETLATGFAAVHFYKTNGAVRNIEVLNLDAP